MIHFITCNYLLAANLVASALLLGHALMAINKMTPKTPHWRRCFYVALAVGAAAVLLGPIYGYVRPQAGEVISNVGAAGLLWGGWWSHKRRATDALKGKRPC